MKRIPDEIVVPGEREGERIDLFLRESLGGCSRGHIRRQIEKGRVLRRGRPVRKGDSVAAGDRLDLSCFATPGSERIVAAEGEKLVVLHQDPGLLVVEKEAGLPTLPIDGEDRFALACRMADRFPELNDVGPPLEAGLLHRLDTGTSGLLAAARTEESYSFLKDQWRWRRVEKSYIAVVVGEARRSFTVLLPIGHHPRSGKRMIAGKGGRSAETRFRSLYVSAAGSVLLAGLREGRRHQIRVHLTEAGHPVVGDPLYGKEKEGSGGRMLLHACSLRFLPRAGGEEIEVRSAPPEDFLREVRGRLGEGAIEKVLSRLPGGRRGR